MDRPQRINVDPNWLRTAFRGVGVGLLTLAVLMVAVVGAWFSHLIPDPPIFAVILGELCFYGILPTVAVGGLLLYYSRRGRRDSRR